MGQSTPTTTMALDEFERRYSHFRAELGRQEKSCFDELVCRARRHSSAINRRPHLDFERPVLLAMLIGEMQHSADLRRRVEHLERLLMDTGLAPRPRPSYAEMARHGQRRL